MGVVSSLIFQENKEKLPIYLLSENSAEEIIHLPIIKTKIKDQTIDLAQYEALIFTSKNGVDAIEHINPLWKKVPAFVIGKPTAQKVKDMGGNVHFIAEKSYGDDFAHEIKDLLIGKKALFLRAKKILSSLEDILISSGVLLDSKIVYETECINSLHVTKIEENSIVIFTSPSTVACFFEFFKWPKNCKAVCIGERTAKAIPKKIPTFISKEQSIFACIALAKTLIKQN